MQQPSDEFLREYEQDAQTPGQDLTGEAGETDESLQHEAGESQSTEQDEEDRRYIVQALGRDLLGRFTQRKTDRAQIEERWRDDLRQYNSVYKEDMEKALRERPYGSKVFYPMTRRICNAVEAKTVDLLFQTDDRNFAVEASPEQSLTEAERLANRIGDPNHPINIGGGRTITADAVRAQLRELREENTVKATRMQRAIDDQLKECRYPTEARKVIHDAIKLGSGVLKAPYVLSKTKCKWIKDAAGNRVKVKVEDLSACAVHVPIWNYYPDLSVGDIESSDGHFELHPMNKAQLAALARQPGFDVEAITRIINAGVSYEGTSQNDSAQREASGNEGVVRESYNIVEYNGPVDHDQLVAFGARMPEDALMVYAGVVWFHETSGEVVKAIVSPLDSTEQPYAIFNWQRDTACVLGYGLPYELRDLQESGNSTLRALLDNMGLSVGGQTVVDDGKVTPANNSWAIEPNKLWRMKANGLEVNKVFGHFPIESRAQEFLAVFNTIKALADEIGGPQMAMQGSDAPAWTQAGATGAAIAYNAASILMRRAVRNWDDQITIPVIGRFIDWNMQYNDDDTIKGDLNAVARGTSALLEADGLVGKLALFMKMSKESGVPVRRIIAQLRKVAESMRFNSEELLPDDNEIRQMEEEIKRNGPPPNPEMERIKVRAADLADKDKQRAHEMQMQEREIEVRMAELSQRDGITADQARVKYGVELRKQAAQMEHEERMDANETQRVNAEMALRAQTGQGI